MTTYWRICIPGGTGMTRGDLPRSDISGSHWAIEDGGAVRVVDHWGVERNPPTPLTATVPEMMRKFGPDTRTEQAKLGIGKYHPRIWRTFYSPRPKQTHEREWTQTVQGARNLFVDMRDVFRCIEPTRGSNSYAHGHRIRELLILACTEVESAWKSVLLANGYPNKKQMNTCDYVKLLEPMALSEWELSLAMHTGFPSFKPFDGWLSTQPTESLPWYADYNAVKHGREAAFAKATLEALVHALGALFVMVSAQFGPWLPILGETDKVERVLSQAPWAGDITLSRSQWADDFSITTLPTWPLADCYVPPWCKDGATWTAKTGAVWTAKPLWS
jgi:hypothetical protein